MSSDDEILVSAETHDRLKQEIEHLSAVVLPEIRREMHLVMELGGGMHDNAPYEHSAYEEQLTLLRIAELQGLLEKAVVYESSVGIADSVAIGGWVETEDLENGKRSSYTIVGAHEEPSPGAVSYLSPMGKALLGRMVGESVVVELPKRILRLRVLAAGPQIRR